MPLHIVQRGHNREAYFLSDRYYGVSLTWLGDDLCDTGCQLQANVLMANHVHLLLTTNAQMQSVLRLLISLGRRYVQYINNAYRPTGML